jgi:LysM repeat protein
MKKSILFSVLVIVITLTTFNLKAQDNAPVVVQVSGEKTVIAGKSYYLHTVKKGENLYRISKAYGVTQKDIILANPETISGSVKDGQVIKIPINPTTPRSIQHIESDNFIYHITEEQQTIFFLTQKYNVTKEILYKYNPELEYSPLQVGQVIRIPKQENVSASSETFSPIEDYEEHKVKKKETKYSISKEYNITVDELIAANPILNTQDLQAGSTIRIPKKSTTQINTKALNELNDSLASNYKLKSENKENTKVSYKPVNETLNIALLLPLSVDDNETRVKLDSVANKGQSEILPRTAYSMEFYNGFLVAVDSLKKRGISVNLYVYDSGKDIDDIKKVLAKKQLLNMDLIIGPFNQEALPLANEFSLKNHILLVSPVIKDFEGVKSNPYFFQFLPDNLIGVKKVIKTIASIEKKKVILIHSNYPSDSSISKLFKKELDSVFTGKYKTVNIQDVSGISKYCSENDENIVIIPSFSETAMVTSLSNLSLISKSYKVQVYGLPECSHYTKIDPDNFYAVDFHYFNPFYIDYNSRAINRFLSMYHYLYNFEPIDFSEEGFNFAMLGFDLGNYFISMLNADKNNLANALQSVNIEPIHMLVKFKKASDNGGYINEGTQILHFTKDYFIKKVD